MSNSKPEVEIPPGLWQLALESEQHGHLSSPDILSVITTTLQWVTENPILPGPNDKLPSLCYMANRSDWPKDETERQALKDASYREGLTNCLADYQRTMFLKKAPPTPQEKLASALSEALVSLSLEQRVAVKSSLLRAGLL